MSPYTILRVSADATDIEIRLAYIKLAREYHPDRNRGDGEKYYEIAYAYGILSTPAKKWLYDIIGESSHEIFAMGREADIYMLLLDKLNIVCYMISLCAFVIFLGVFPIFFLFERQKHFLLPILPIVSFAVLCIPLARLIKLQKNRNINAVLVRTLVYIFILVSLFMLQVLFCSSVYRFGIQFPKSLIFATPEITRHIFRYLCNITTEITFPAIQSSLMVVLLAISSILIRVECIILYTMFLLWELGFKNVLSIIFLSVPFAMSVTSAALFQAGIFCWYSYIPVALVDITIIVVTFLLIRLFKYHSNYRIPVTHHEALI